MQGRPRHIQIAAGPSFPPKCKRLRGVLSVECGSIGWQKRRRQPRHGRGCAAVAFL
jgi:hypothetical protein